ncbi:hypothetical protein Poly24_01220 [Rosistilla carotiformis]|uniref:DUF4783 domain-containing protein n=1 Tax=Rosistilla carotiformis TaxID=2528017 RepID=A0A518JLL5_9BACT|nr:hypothetical protein [Rosistilla carotiformis]QDV66436.1 hypothetical protein Poly24_01220 [Rosistilla carotiformis]
MFPTLRLHVLVIALIPSVGHAQTLSDAIAGMTEHVASFLKESGRDRVLLGSFDRKFETSMGRNIQSSFEESLPKNDILVVDEGADTRLFGEYSIRQLASHSILTVTVTLVNSRGKVLNQYRRRVKIT